MTQIVSRSPKPRMERQPASISSSESFSELDAVAVLLSAGEFMQGRTVSLANGGIIHCRGRSLKKIRGPRVTAVNVDAWRCGSPEPELLWTTRPIPAERAPHERSSRSLRL